MFIFACAARASAHFPLIPHENHHSRTSGPRNEPAANEAGAACGGRRNPRSHRTSASAEMKKSRRFQTERDSGIKAGKHGVCLRRGQPRVQKGAESRVLGRIGVGDGAPSLFKPLGLLVLLPGERSIKGLQFCVCGFGRRVNTRVCVFYLGSHCLICIFHHVKQIEDNEGLGDEGRSCAPHTERSICFQCNTKGLLSEKPSLAMH